MLRELIVNTAESAPAQYKSVAKVTTGTPVVIDKTAGTFATPSKETAANLYFVDKERYATGVYAGVTNMSDYHENYTTVEANEYAKLCGYGYTDVFATSEYDSTIIESNIGKRVAAKGGKIILATTVASKYVFDGFYNDNGHKLAKISVADDAVANS